MGSPWVLKTPVLMERTGRARSEVTCGDTARLPPGTLSYHLTLPVMTSSKDIPNELGTRGTEKEGVPTRLVSLDSNQENVQESPAMFKQPGFLEGHRMGMWHPRLGV